jgi:hypothetical protein
MYCWLQPPDCYKEAWLQHHSTVVLLLLPLPELVTAGQTELTIFVETNEAFRRKRQFNWDLPK